MGQATSAEGGRHDPAWLCSTAHSQWGVLTRKDATTLTTGGDLEVWYRAYKQMLRLELVKRSYLLAPDELFILTYLRHYHRTRELPFNFQNRKSTFAHCCLDFVNCEWCV